jgi:type III secretion system YscQ/HrcQ family protein
MLFKRKNSNEHNLSVSKIQLPHLSKSELDFKQFLLRKIFIWKNKQIHINNVNSVQKAEHYIGIHTETGIFYIHNGLAWLQKLTSIYIEHEDEDTQNWLLERALENLPKDAFFFTIDGLSFHHYINVNKYKALYLNGFSSKIIYTSTDTWIKLFKKHRFIRKHTFSIDNIEIQKNILLGSQKLQYTDYKKLVCGNIILINISNFNLDGAANIEIGKFTMSALYHDNTLIFQAWNSNMNDKPYKETQEEDEEWTQDEASLVNNYNDFNLNELNQNNFNDSQEELQEENYQEEQIPDEELEENTEHIEDDEEHPFGNVPINLSFSLGSLRMPISNIMHLQEGSIIELNKNIPAQVSIYANSKLIGTGDVVEIDGKLGVQINKLEKD